MKTIKDFRFPFLVILGSLIIVLFTSYGNKKVHPDINSMIVDAFLKRNTKSDFSQGDFKKYTFFFEAGTTLRGTTIVKDGLFSDLDVTAAGWGLGTNLSSEGAAEMTPKKWISTGGYAADVPEVPASLRHFFDPTRSAGDRYLTDITNAKIMGSLQKYVLTNPRIDGVEWALGKPGDISEGVQDHKYTWEHGKLWMQMALREPKQEKRNEYMANAWRALGETLHMIADNGCPPHVRNDAHPSPLWNNNSFFGNPDPYEELMDVIRRDNSSEFTGLAKGSANAALVQEFRNSKKVYDIANALAVFTNANFVTNETISGVDKYGEDKKQITHPDIAYNSLRLESMTYNNDDNGYYFAGTKQCTDHYYFANLIPKICDPFVDMECVKSQARVLFPNIVEAGANVIKLYIPKLTVEIKSLDKGILKGEIKHRTDEEYPAEIKYNGEVTLLIKNKNNREADKIKVEAKDGKFEEKDIKLAKDEKMVAQIEFGGVIVESDEFIGVSDNVFGLYQGTYTMQINESNMLEAGYSRIGPSADAETRKMAEEMVQADVKLFKENFNWLKGGAQGGLITKFEIGKTKGMEYYYETQGLQYYVYNLSNTSYIPKFLTPLVDKSNAGTTLKCKSNGFTCTVVTNEETYIINATFQGNNLVGDWKHIFNGKVLQSATFSARKILDM